MCPRACLPLVCFSCRRVRPLVKLEIGIINRVAICSSGQYVRILIYLERLAFNMKRSTSNSQRGRHADRAAWLQGGSVMTASQKNAGGTPAPLRGGRCGLPPDSTKRSQFKNDEIRAED